MPATTAYCTSAATVELLTVPLPFVFTVQPAHRVCCCRTTPFVTVEHVAVVVVTLAVHTVGPRHVQVSGWPRLNVSYMHLLQL